MHVYDHPSSLSINIKFAAVPSNFGKILQNQTFILFCWYQVNFVWLISIVSCTSLSNKGAESYRTKWNI